MKNYIIKRSPDFTKNGVIVKRNIKNKGYTESKINAKPFSNKLDEGDIVYVSETGYGIYAKGKVIEVGKIITFNTVKEILSYYKLQKLNDASYWLGLINRLNEAKNKNEKSVLNYQEFKIEQKLLDKVIPLEDKLDSLRKIQISLSLIKNDLIEFIESPQVKSINSLESKIPNALRLDLYSLFNKKCNITTWIDIDHFIPKSIGGPGNIPENLVPVGFSLNRYKSDSIPSGLFLIANEIDELKKHCKLSYFKNEPTFLKSKQVKNDATKIIGYVKKLKIEEARLFFKKVLHHHNPEYIRIIEEINN